MLPPRWIGNSRKHTDICLHDLFDDRVHCHVKNLESGVTVHDQVTANGILVNGAKVALQTLHPGDVVRIGNSYLRLEAAPEAVNGEVPPVVDPNELPLLPLGPIGALTGHLLGHFEVGLAITATPGRCSAPPTPTPIKRSP